MAIAAVEVLDGHVTGRAFYTRINPRSPVSRFATRIHGMTERSAAKEPLFSDIAPALLSFLGDSPIFAHAASGDRALLNHDLEVLQLSPLPPARFICTQKAATHYFGHKQIGLNALCKRLGVAGRHSKKHDALEDAHMAAHCALAMAMKGGHQDVDWAQFKLGEKSAGKLKGRSTTQWENGIATFRRDGIVVGECALPVPPGYRVITKPNTVLVMPAGAQRPSNPLGASIVYMSGGDITMKA